MAVEDVRGSGLSAGTDDVFEACEKGKYTLPFFEFNFLSQLCVVKMHGLLEVPRQAVH